MASFLSLLISLIGEDEILNLDGHTLDIEALDHLHLWQNLLRNSGPRALIVVSIDL